jgi:hypothetical protein
MKDEAERRRGVIDKVRPEVDGGRFPAGCSGPQEAGRRGAGRSSRPARGAGLLTGARYLWHGSRKLRPARSCRRTSSACGRNGISTISSDAWHAKR